jgi:ADP-ribosylglycohydrolase
MLGAIIGDIIGSPYERPEYNIKTMDFPLFNSYSRFTDDTVMTIAVADGLMAGYGDEARTESAITRAMQEYGRLYPSAGYGNEFKKWLASDNPKPYKSFGNGSAMRVSPVAWMFDDLPTVEKYAWISAQVTHNHPEGLNGAASVAVAIFLARTGKSRAEIKRYVEDNYAYNLRRKLDDIRPDYFFTSNCRHSVPEAIIAFLESNGFEDAIRKAVSLGGDSDTIAAIAGSIAEAYYGIPEELIRRATEFLDDRLLSVIAKWNKFIHEKNRTDIG